MDAPNERRFGDHLVVKYCEPKVANSILNGEVWLGTLKRYREAEAKNGLMDDDEEGVGQLDLGNGYFGWGKPLNIGGSTFQECVGMGNAPGAAAFSAHTEVNKFVLCLSNGAYSRSHHQEMLYGSSEYPDYRGNPDHTHFIVFDIYTLAVCLLSWAKAHYGTSAISSYPCTYGKRRREITQSENVEGVIDPTFIVWTKPVRFTIENEWRIALKIGARPPRGRYDVLKVKSPALTSAIVAFGEYQD